VDYLEHHLGFHIAEEIAERIPARDLLLVASQNGKRRTHACVVLKVMHVLQHLAGRELVNRLSVSADQIFHAVEDKVLRTVEEMKARAAPSWSSSGAARSRTASSPSFWPNATTSQRMSTTSCASA